MIDLFRRAGLQLQRQKNVYRIALVACVVFQALHLLALPLVMSPDGLEYVALSERFGSAGFFEHWSYVRMPLYPLFLRASFDLFGRFPGAALFPARTQPTSDVPRKRTSGPQRRTFRPSATRCRRGTVEPGRAAVVPPSERSGR